jgi:methyl-accepting chemotaxis protein
VNTSKPKIDAEKENRWSTMGNDDMMETNAGETLMTESNGNGKIDALIDQVGRLTEGITDLKGIVERVAQTVERVAQSTERQERNIDRLTVVSEQQSETTQRLVKIVEGLLEKK